MRKILLVARVLLFPRFGREEVILQYFETQRDEIYQRLPEIAGDGPSQHFAVRLPRDSTCDPTVAVLWIKTQTAFNRLHLRAGAHLR